eukprot:808075-Rhodomonas_salina.3
MGHSGMELCRQHAGFAMRGPPLVLCRTIYPQASQHAIPAQQPRENSRRRALPWMNAAALPVIRQRKERGRTR